MKKQPEQMPEDQRFHDTYLLLKKYRDVVWSLELSVQQVKRRFQMEVGSSIEDFLESIYLAGVDFSDNGIEEQARSIEKSYQMLKLLETKADDGSIVYEESLVKRLPKAPRRKDKI